MQLSSIPRIVAKLASASARRGYFAANPQTFFSINPDVFDVQADATEILVQTDDPAMNTSVCAGKARWNITTEPNLNSDPEALAPP